MPDSLPSRSLAVAQRPLVAASATYTPQQFQNAQIFGYQPWQDEAWAFRRTLGEFFEATDWQARAMSRIRLGAAEVVPGADEPEMLTDGPAAELMQEFCGGPPGHSAFLRAITPQLTIPGDGWLIAERDDPRIPLSQADWGVYSTNCIWPVGYTYKVRVGEATWRDLAPDNLPIRIYQPDPQWPWLATSNAQAAIPIMRRIFLIDSRIVAMMVSRLVMNGFLLIPAEGTIGVPDQYKQAPDPFIAMLMDIGSRNIKNPGLASAGFPIPIRFTEKLIEKWKLLKPDDPLDEWLLKERLDELGRLGDTLGIDRNRVTGGMGEQNHWNAWQISEEEIRLCFAPLAEVICGAVTKAYLVRALRQEGLPLVGAQGGRLIAWYDTTELSAKPDMAERAGAMYADGVINETAYRREAGFDESDALTDPDEIETWANKRIIVKGVAELIPAAISELTGQPAMTPTEGAGPTVAPDAPAPSVGSPRTMPDTRAEPPPQPGGTPPRPAPPALVASAGALGRALSRVGNGHVNGSTHR